MVYDNRTTGVAPQRGSTVSYTVPRDMSSAYHLTVNVNNMADVAGQVLLKWVVSGTAAAPQTQYVSIGPRGVTSASFVANLTASVEASRRSCEVGTAGSNACCASSWGIATVDVAATVSTGFGWTADEIALLFRAKDGEERLSLNFATV